MKQVLQTRGRGHSLMAIGARAVGLFATLRIVTLGTWFSMITPASSGVSNGLTRILAD
jgi:hypothetical protein